MEQKKVRGVTKLKCPRCGKWDSKDAFYFRGDGTPFTHKPCEKLRQQARAAAKKSAKPKAAAKKRKTTKK